MATPASGAISMNDMNVQITRASGTATLSMDTIRTRYGGSGAISFNDLYNTEGFTLTCGVFSSKFVTYNGYSEGVIGSVSPAEVSSRVQFAANSYLESMIALSGTPTTTLSALASTPGGNGSGITAGFKGTNVTRVVAANTSRTITASSNDTFSYTYTMPGTGTIHCLLKF